jgi:signal peptidase I
VFVLVDVRLYREPSSSMEPTLHCGRPASGCEGSDNDRFAVLKLGGVGRGDIVVFEATRRAVETCGVGGMFVKRIVGLPGETVAERGGALFVDGRRLDERYLEAAYRDHVTGRWHVPAGSYFLVGDNRVQSCDSRAFGAVPKGNVVGRVVFVYWPPNRVGFR